LLVCIPPEVPEDTVIHEQSALSYLDGRAKRVVEVARERADGLSSAAIEPEHILLALLSVRGGVAAQSMTNLAGSAAVAGTAIAEGLRPGYRRSPIHIPFTTICEEAMVRAAQHARLLGDDRIGTKHLLLGLLTVTGNAAVRRLSDVGVDYDAVRSEIARIRSDGTDRR
jgi:ATP-dependent Clp protease ATP-binding subunit ClpA